MSIWDYALVIVVALWIWEVIMIGIPLIREALIGWRERRKSQ